MLTCQDGKRRRPGRPILDAARQHSALLLEIQGEKFLFDAGMGVTSQMQKWVFSPNKLRLYSTLTTIFDHIGSLGECLLPVWHNGRQAPVTIYGPPGDWCYRDCVI